MLNLKKGLALVLAAATAFTFAPVANLGNVVEANATSVTAAQTTTLTVGQSLHYTVPTDNLATSLNYQINISDNTVVTSDVATDHDTPITTPFNLTAESTGIGKSATVKVTYPINNEGTTTTATFQISVKAKSDQPDFSKQLSGINTSVTSTAINTTTTGSDGQAADGTNWVPVSVTSSNTAVATTSSTTINWKGVKGTTVIEVTAHKYGETAVKTFSYTVTVIADHSSLDDGDTKNITTTSGAASVTSSLEIAKTTGTANVTSVKLSDPQNQNEKLTYSVVVTDPTVTGTAAKAVSVDKTGKVTATAEAFEHSGAYQILVTNGLAGASEKATKVKLVLVGSPRTFASVDATIDGTTYSAKAGYKADGSIQDGSKDATLTLSSKAGDKNSVAVTLKSVPANATVTPNDPSVVAYENGSLVAKKVGSTIVNIKAAADANTYGNATIALAVTVTDQAVLNPITVVKDPITLTAKSPKAKVEATAAGKNTLHYDFVKQDAKGNWVITTVEGLTIDRATGDIVYDPSTGKSGTATVRVTGDANATSLAPQAKNVTVIYRANKLDSKLNITTKSLNLNSGDKGTIVATGTALSYAVDNSNVATVDAKTGEVTAVKKGVAVVTVSDAGDDNYAAATGTVVVYVDGAKVVPAKVTGVKVANKKGAKVTVTWASQSKNINYRVYKKVGNGSWKAKNVAGNKTTLSVKKGAKVTVKVKAYVKDENGKTTWGPKATQKSFKTDNK